MDPAPARIPAWQRLGLELKQDQSGPKAPADGLHIARYQHGYPPSAQKDTLKFGGGASRPHSENLGKRKHPAEHQAKASKKNKKTEEEDHGPGVTVQTAPVIPDVGRGLDEPRSTTASSPDKPRKTGDSNYRKKGDSNYRKKKDGKRSHHVRPRTPSLSPGPLDLASDGGTLLASTETDFHAMPPAEAGKTTNLLVRKDNSSSLSQSPGVGRRKSVTFTPDTKTVDGSSASNLFKKWVQEQKGSGAELSQTDIAVLTPPKSHPANHNPSSSVATGKRDKALGPSESKADQFVASAQDKTTSGPKKKDPSRYTSYLAQYYTDRPNWKFNKAKQNDVLENALNIFRIPDTFLGALLSYVQGLKGAGVIDRLKHRCKTAIEQIDEEMSSVDDAEMRKAAQEEALQERLSRERKRRRLEGDIENMLDHPYSEGYIRRLKKSRAEALLAALNLAAPAPTPAKTSMNSLPRKFSPETTASLPPFRDSNKRKRRTSVSSDESSDSSSSSEESSSSSEDDSGSDSTSGSGSESESDSGSDPESSSDAKSSSDSGSHSTSSGEDSDGEQRRSGRSSSDGGDEIELDRQQDSGSDGDI